jgi:hypothetical protein
MTRRTKFLIIAGAGILILAAVIIGIIIKCTGKEEEIMPIDSSLVTPYLKDGDIILRLGDGPLSNGFRNMSLTDKRFSHLGIVRIKDGNISIINSLGYITKKKRGVEVNTVEGLLFGAKAVGVFRANFIEGSKISDKAVEYVNYPFDWDFDISDDSKIYCTELLYAVLKSYGLENYLKTYYLEKLFRDIVPVDSISNSTAFDEILYIK